MTKNILVGYRVGTGEPVYMSPKHTMITGMTGDAGKTTAVLGIASRWEGQKFVVFQTKIGEDVFDGGSYRKITPYFKQKTANWQYIEALIEASQGEKIKIIRTTLMKVCERAQTIDDVFANVSKRIADYDKKDKGGFEYDMLYQVREYLRQVIVELGKYKFADSLDLQEGVNVVDLTDIAAADNGTVMISMIIGATADEIQRKHDHTSIVIPEAWQTIPGDRKSPATPSVEALIRQGRVRSNFVIIDSQDIAGVNSKIRRHIANYMLGKQQDEHEVERTVKAIPLPPKQRPRADEIQTLKKGQFFAIIDERMEKIYARPAWMDEEQAIAIAKDPSRMSGSIGKSLSFTVNNHLPKGPREITVETSKDDEQEDLVSTLEVAGLQAKLEDLNKKYAELQDHDSRMMKDALKAETQLKVEKERADSLLAERNQLHLQRKMMADFLWPVYKDYLDDLPKQAFKAAAKQEGDAGEIEVTERRASISINKVREPIKFEEDSVEGVLVKMAKNGQLDAYQTVGKIREAMNDVGITFDEGTVRAALDRFAVSPFHLLEKKQQANKAWTFRLNKEEAEEAFKE